jgi:hypothetical protein
MTRQHMSTPTAGATLADTTPGTTPWPNDPIEPQPEPEGPTPTDPAPAPEP